MIETTFFKGIKSRYKMCRIFIILYIVMLIYIPDVYSADIWEQHTAQSSTFASGFINVGAVDTSGKIWFGRDAGLVSFDGLLWEGYTTQNSGLTKEKIFTMDIDQSNVLWIGYGLYLDGGLTSFDGKNWKQYTVENSRLPSNFIVSVAVDNSNVKWIGTRLGLASFDDETWKTYSFDDSTFMREVYLSMADNDNVKWFFWGRGLYDYQGVASFNGKNWTLYNMENSGLRGNYISSMAVDKNNKKWFAYGLGKAGGVTCFDGKEWISYTKENGGLPDDTVLSIAIDNNNVLWCGAMFGGITCFDGKTWRTYVNIKDVEGNEIVNFQSAQIEYIGIGNDNSKWFCSATQGLWRFKEGSTAVSENSYRPESFHLSNTPNPFNPSTVIGFNLASPLSVRLAVYSASGQKVCELASGHMNAGRHSVAWDSRDGAGQPVSSGVYLYRLEAVGRSETKRMLLLR